MRLIFTISFFFLLFGCVSRKSLDQYIKEVPIYEISQITDSTAIYEEDCFDYHFCDLGTVRTPVIKLPNTKVFDSTSNFRITISGIIKFKQKNCLPLLSSDMKSICITQIYTCERHNGKNVLKKYDNKSQIRELEKVITSDVLNELVDYFLFVNRNKEFRINVNTKSLPVSCTFRL